MIGAGTAKAPRARQRSSRRPAAPLAGGQAHPRPFEEREAGLVERALGGLDWVLALAAIGLIAFSAYTLGITTKQDVAGDPYFYVIRQCIYGVIGIARIESSNTQGQGHC